MTIFSTSKWRFISSMKSPKSLPTPPTNPSVTPSLLRLKSSLPNEFKCRPSQGLLGCDEKGKLQFFSHWIETRNVEKSSWWFQLIWNICSSKWIISPAQRHLGRWFEWFCPFQLFGVFELQNVTYRYIWVFPKIVVFPPKSSILIGFKPLFSPSILGVFPLFSETPPYSYITQTPTNVFSVLNAKSGGSNRLIRNAQDIIATQEYCLTTTGVTACRDAILEM